jgi:hypothetical protein
MSHGVRIFSSDSDVIFDSSSYSASLGFTVTKITIDRGVNINAPTSGAVDVPSINGIATYQYASVIHGLEHYYDDQQSAYYRSLNTSTFVAPLITRSGTIIYWKVKWITGNQFSYTKYFIPTKFDIVIVGGI